MLFPIIPSLVHFVATFCFSLGCRHAAENGGQWEDLHLWEMGHGHSLAVDLAVLLHH